MGIQWDIDSAIVYPKFEANIQKILGQRTSDVFKSTSEFQTRQSYTSDIAAMLTLVNH